MRDYRDTWNVPVTYTTRQRAELLMATKYWHGWSDIESNPAMETLAKLLGHMTVGLMNITGRQLVTKIIVRAEDGPLLGIQPGTKVTIATPTGRVEVWAEANGDDDDD